MTPSIYSHRRGALAASVSVLAAGSVLLAACGSSSKTSSSSSATNPPAASGASNAEVTVRAASLPGLGSVLENGNGQVLYVLASEKGGKITCTDANGCTKIWPPAALPSGMSQGEAGSGVQASLLGTKKGPSGDLRLTYAGWPLYTFTGDSGPGKPMGQGVKDVWGTW